MQWLAAPVTGPPEMPAPASPAPSPAPWTSPAPMSSSEPQATSPEPSSGGLERGAYSHFEVFGGYSYFRGDDPVNGSYNLHGWNSAFIQNINQWVGIVADVSGPLRYAFRPFVRYPAQPHIPFRTTVLHAVPFASHSLCARIVWFFSCQPGHGRRFHQ